MATKSLGLLFFVLTLLNIPVYMFYYNANEWEIDAPQEMFARVSLGNMGATQLTCSSANYPQENEMTLSCGNGTIAGLSFFGLTKHSGTKCELIQNYKNFEERREFFDQECFYSMSSKKNETQWFNDLPVGNTTLKSRFRNYYNKTCIG